jgi:hypothetical protein
LKKKLCIILTMGIFFVTFNFFSGNFNVMADILLNLPLKFQEQTQWCWAGTSQSILQYYRNTVSQCEIADWARQANSWGSDNCCSNPGGSICNQLNSMSGTNGDLVHILYHWVVSSSSHVGHLYWNILKQEINAFRPFIMRFGWTSGGGHFLVGYGYDPGGVYMDYMDPWPGNGFTRSTYDWVVSSADHTWTHTLMCESTPPILPTVTSGSATNVTGGAATLNGTVNPNGINTTYYFQWGTTTGYGNTTSSQSAGNGLSNVAVSANITRLIPNTTYHYRVVATNWTGTTNGSDKTFKTLIASLPWLMLLFD